MEFAVSQDKIGELITDSVKMLLESRRHMRGRFTDIDEEWGAGGGHGPCTSMQGIRSVLGAFTALAEDEKSGIWEVIEPNLQLLFEEWREVLAELERDGYGARPYDKQNSLTEILNEGNPRRLGSAESYVDTLSWVVSTAVLFNYSARVLQSQRRISPLSSLLDSNRQQLARSLTLLLDAQCPDGGWAWARGAETGHLYFTWSTVQGLADYYDYILGESEAQIGIPADHEVVAWLDANHPELRTRVDKARKSALQFLTEKYLGKATSVGLGLDDFSIDKRIEPLDRNYPNIIIYYELYLLESLILLGYDIPAGKVSPSNRAELKQLYSQIIERFTNIRHLPDTDSFWNDPNASTLRFNLLSTKQFQGRPHSFLVQDPGLWPQFLRTMILYRFYTDPGDGPDVNIVKSQESALSLLLDDKRPPGQGVGDGLWDRINFNLTITARSIEALIDVYDYYQLLTEREHVATEVATGELAAVIAEAVYPYILPKLSVTPPMQQEHGDGNTAADLQRELRAFVRKDSFSEPLLGLLVDALDSIKEWGGPSRNQILVEFLGKRAADQLEQSNPDAYKLLEQLAWTIFCLCVRLLPLVVAESAILHFSENEDVTQFRRVEADATKGHQRLADRLKLALQELMASEVSAAEKRPGDPPSYKELVQGLLAQPLAVKGKGK